MKITTGFNITKRWWEVSLLPNITVFRTAYSTTITINLLIGWVMIYEPRADKTPK